MEPKFINMCLRAQQIKAYRILEVDSLQVNKELVAM